MTHEPIDQERLSGLMTSEQPPPDQSIRIYVSPRKDPNSDTVVIVSEFIMRHYLKCQSKASSAKDVFNASLIAAFIS